MGSIVPFGERKDRGESHEDAVKRELERRGWTANYYGLRLLSDQVKRHLTHSKNRLRWDPDLIIANTSELWLIDCKTDMSGAGVRYHINRDAFLAQLALSSTYRIPLAFVFGNMSVAMPDDIMHACRVRSFDKMPAYLAFPAPMARPMDDIFGAVQWYADAA